MNSVMHNIIEYWSRDYEVSTGWRRDPTFEGPVEEAPLDPPDIVGEVLTAIGTGSAPVQVMCTSQRSRFDLAGRITAAMATEGRVLVAYYETYPVVAHKMLEGLVPDTNVGHWNDARTVTLAEFAHVKDVRLAMFDSVVILSGPRTRNEVVQKACRDAMTQLASEAGDKVQVEFALAHSVRMIAKPRLVVDVGQKIRSGLKVREER